MSESPDDDELQGRIEDTVTVRAPTGFRVGTLEERDAIAGTALVEGIYFGVVGDKLYYYDGAAWIDALQGPLAHAHDIPVHEHDHGEQAGGSLHALATAEVAGFMSSADKAKLDGVDSGSAEQLVVLAAQEDASAGFYPLATLAVDVEADKVYEIDGVVLARHLNVGAGGTILVGLGGTAVPAADGFVLTETGFSGLGFHVESSIAVAEYDDAGWGQSNTPTEVRPYRLRGVIVVQTAGTLRPSVRSTNAVVLPGSFLRLRELP